MIMQGLGSGVTLSEGLYKLVSEHVPLRTSLDSLYSLCDTVEEENGASFPQLVQDVKHFSTDLDYHSVREEDILFRMMEGYLGKGGGPISVMEYEHQQAHGFINEFLKNAESLSQLTTDDKMQNVDLVRNAYHTLLNHFMKEEQVLYPMAERMFTDEEKEIFNKKVSEKR